MRSKLLRAKLADVKACPSCGWVMKLVTDTDPHPVNADVSPVKFYLCANRACEHAERAA